MQIGCDIHHERAFIAVFDHPYFAVTGVNGSFKFQAKLRPGVYTLVTWHERLGIHEKRIICLKPTEVVEVQLTH
jgi:hypothetical protein